MARQYFSSDGGVINETGTRQYFSSDGGLVNETDGSVATVNAAITWTEANDTFSVTVDVTVSNPQATISWTEANDTWAITGSVTSTAGTLTTGVFKNNTGSVLANLSNLTVAVLNLSDLTFVKRFSGQGTNESGVIVITDALFIAGNQYALVTTNASGTLGVEKYQAT